jgi:hypothetical protein
VSQSRRCPGSVPRRNHLAFLVTVAASGLVAASCGGSSSSGGSPSDAGGDITRKGMGAIVEDGGDAGSDATGMAYDGTTGQPCKTDADCVGPGGPGLAKCSNSLTATITGVAITPLAKPVCVVPTCDSAPPDDPTGQYVHFCDGPDVPGSPGICLPDGSGGGICLPVCTFNFDGTAPTGCLAPDTCVPYIVDTDMNQNVVGGGGFCEGDCQSDSDCSALGTGWSCQTDIGYCTQHPRVRTKQIGDSCTSNTTACNCVVGQNSTSGFCSSTCVVGSTVACPDGWVCDNGEASVLPDGTTTPAENIMTMGTCFAPCALADGGSTLPEAAAPEASTPLGGVDGSADGATDGPSSSAPEAEAPASCPAGTTCQGGTPAGPDCVSP